MPKASMTIMLSDTRYKYTRSKYTFFQLLGDFGGFNGAIIMLPTVLVSFYTQRMFNAAVARDTPVRKP